MITDINISKIRKLDGSLLLVLKELLEHESVTQTAKSLNLSQSAVSHSLSRLRELFDDPLFTRRPHGLEPTDKAISLKPKIDVLLDLTATTLGLTNEFDPAVSNRMFTLSAPEFATIIGAPALLNSLEQSAPRTGVKFIHLPSEDAFEQIRRGRLVAALGRYHDVPTPPEIDTSPLFKDEYCVVARKNHPVLKRKCTEKQYVQCAHLWAGDGSELTSSEIDGDYSSFHGSIVPRWLTALTLAAQTDMIVACPRRLAESQASVLPISLFNPPFEIPGIEISLAKSRNLSDPGSRWFLEQVVQAFSI